VFARKRQSQRYNHIKNYSSRLGGTPCFRCFVRLDLDVFLSNTEFSFKHYLVVSLVSYPMVKLSILKVVRISNSLNLS